MSVSCLRTQVVKQGPGERNYHIFELLLQDSNIGQVNLQGLSSFQYLQSRRTDDDNLKAEYNEVVEALAKVGFSDEEILDIKRILATILLLGNFEFSDTSSDKAEITTTDELGRAAENLGVDPENLRIGFMTKRLEVVGQAIIQELSVQDVSPAPPPSQKIK